MSDRKLWFISWPMTTRPIVAAIIQNLNFLTGEAGKQRCRKYWEAYYSFALKKIKLTYLKRRNVLCSCAQHWFSSQNIEKITFSTHFRENGIQFSQKQLAVQYSLLTFTLKMFKNIYLILLLVSNRKPLRINLAHCTYYFYFVHC